MCQWELSALMEWQGPPRNMGPKVLEFRGETVQEFLVYNGTCVQVQWVSPLFVATHFPLNSPSIWGNSIL